MIEAIPFDASAGPSLGVEWELALVDHGTRDLSNVAAEVIEAARSDDSLADRIHHELLRNTVELVTGVCADVGEAMGDLAGALHRVRSVAEQFGVDLYGAGTHPFAQWSTQLLTPGHRYAELIERTQWWGRQMLIWGVHVHVGINHRDKVFPILNALLSYYPHLLALSASSPMWSAHDTGYASNRAMMFQQLPTAGLPFQFGKWVEFEAFVADQKTTGIIDHINEIRWDIRPSPHLGTIEVRVCDGVSNLGELAALVSLIHCLVVDFDLRLDAGETLPNMAPWLVQENKWRAARYGLEAVVILDSSCREELVTDDLDRLIATLEPVARELNCVSELRSVLSIPRAGASYQRQRKVFAATNDPTSVVTSVVDELDA